MFCFFVFSYAFLEFVALFLLLNLSRQITYYFIAFGEVETLEE